MSWPWQPYGPVELQAPPAWPAPHVTPAAVSSSSPQVATGPTKPPTCGPTSQPGLRPSLQPCLDHSCRLSRPDTPAWAWPHPQGCPMAQAKATQCPTPQGALTTPGATTTGSLQLTGHLGRFNQHEKQKINLKPPAAVCTRNSNSLSKHTRQQTGSNACAYSGLLLSHSYSKSHKDRKRKNKGIKQTKLVFTLF